jgi:hypothetical protein
MTRGGLEVWHERKKKKETRSSFGGALLLKPHEAVDDGSVAAAAKPWARARWQPPLSKGGWRGLGTVRAVRLTLGVHAVL